MSQRTVYVVDDHPEFLASTRFLLACAGFDAQGWTDPQAAIAALAQRDRSRPACLMLDIRMPGMSGLELHDAIGGRAAPLPVIYMSGHADVPIAVQAMRKGAVTLLEKPFDDAALAEALEAAFTAAEQAAHAGAGAGASAAPASSAPSHADPLPSPSASPSALPSPSPSAAASPARAEFLARESRLTPRERQVLSHVVQGTYNKVIADRIGLSVKTVEVYRARGMEKMKARSVAELTRMMVSGEA